MVDVFTKNTIKGYNKKRINVSNALDGYYYIKISGENTEIVKPLIIQH